MKAIPLNNPKRLLVANKRTLNIGNEIIGSVTFRSMKNEGNKQHGKKNSEQA
ncbi:hypothetical protein GCM10020331_080490 [Ectobacillus funiculus]